MESDEGSDLGGAVKIFAKVEEVFRTENQGEQLVTYCSIDINL